ncbi:hypothetical protein AAZV13_20G058200 [Glycine max]
MSSSFSKFQNFLSLVPNNVMSCAFLSLVCASISFLILPIILGHLFRSSFVISSSSFVSITGLGWDGEKKTIAASDEWWEGKIQKAAIFETLNTVKKQET